MELPVTTFWPSNVTVDSSTADPTYMTTTIPVSPQTSTYKVMKNSIACLIIEGRFQLIVSYIKWDNGIVFTYRVSLSDIGQIQIHGQKKCRCPRVQTFNVENGKFSENGYDCNEDVEPIPGPGNAPVHMFTVADNNITCIVIKGGFQFNIPYMSYNGKIVIGFYNTWKLTLYFSSDVKQREILAREHVTKYHISHIELDYDFNNNLFTDAVDNILGTNKTAVTACLRALTTNEDQSYMCKKDSTFNIQNGVSMITKELQFQAFKTENLTAFSSAVYCKDNGDNYIVLISTGAALGGLLLSVAVLVIVYKKRQNYEQLTH
ncbi:uncharacterized protein LOC134257517 [Saccostrea cucullata]|uniref:uncharacterized protein LOC134257517 n=1 Tax=Saccostrea cuccullata TaxID=36930 RepID=UPI002ED4517B